MGVELFGRLARVTVAPIDGGDPGVGVGYVAPELAQLLADQQAATARDDAGDGQTARVVRYLSPALLDGLDLQEWDEDALRACIGVIFQDFSRYQFLLGENVGVGDVRHFDDETRWREATAKGMADELVEDLPQGFATQLGKWFKDGQELSGGQWQKIALARAFMRTDADILVLDEPTAAMDAAAEAAIFEHFRKLTENRIAILISHRFSTVRMASQIVVIENGRIIERGSHEDLMTLDGHYARLFSLQAAGYR